MSTALRERAPAPDLPAPQRRRRWPVVLAVSLILALGAGLGYVLAFTSVFALTGVTVLGTTPALEQQVRVRLADEQGVPLVRIDTGAVQQDLATIPEFASVTVERRWPHSLTVTVVPRRAVALTQANDAWYSLDATGVPFAPTRTRPRGLVAIELATPGPQDPATAAALQVVRDLPAGLPARISAVRAASPYRIELLLTDKRTVVWGDASDGPAKARVLPLMLQRPGTVFDLSDPTMVTVR